MVKTDNKAVLVWWDNDAALSLMLICGVRDGCFNMALLDFG